MPAPYSDNLYSNLDSGLSNPVSDDANNEQDALSPTDGYFHASTIPGYSSAPSTETASSSHRRQSSNVPFVPNVLVEDPTMQGSIADKAREAAQQINTSPPEHSSPSTSSQRQPPSLLSTSSVVYTPSHPTQSASSVSYPHLPTINQLGAADAPPAYTPTSPTASTGYQTFPSTESAAEMGNPESEHLLSSAGPYHPGAGGPPKPPVWQRIKESTKSSRLRSSIRTILGVLVLVSVFLALFGGINFNLDDKRYPPAFEHKKPVKSPAMDDGDFLWAPPANCLNRQASTWTSQYAVDFDLRKSLRIIQEIDHYRGPRRGVSHHISGNVIIRPVTKGKSAGLVLEMLSNEKEMAVEVTYFSTNSNVQQLKVTTPSWLDWSSESRNEGPCIQMRIILYVPDEALLKEITVNTVQLDVTIADGLALGVGSGTRIATVTGNVATSPKDVKKLPYNLASRETHVMSVSGDISGWFPLYDLLELSSTSGDINVEVSPKWADDEHPAPAKLKIQSTSGDVTVKEDIDNGSALPKRNYITEIGSTSGQVRADVVIGQSTKVHSISGDLDLQLQPMLHNDWASGEQPKLETSATSGRQTINILEPIIAEWNTRAINEKDDHDMKIRKENLKGLTNYKTSHSTTSGDIYVSYPASWEGTLNAETMTGDITVKGKDLRVKRKNGWVQKSAEIEKGNGESQGKLVSLSGDIDILIGSV